MPASRLASVFRTGPTPPSADSRSDADLLTRFLHHHDEAAFAALVARHTPAIRSVCRSWLRSPSDIDDATQATFLVLVRRADSIRDRRALAAWLYRVAANVSRRLRVSFSKTDPLVADVAQPDAAEPFDDRTESLAEEVARLPEKYRLPVQLCYSAGLSTALAADRLGLPKGTVLTRLSRARKLLQRRLAARGLAAVTMAGALPVGSVVSAEFVKQTAAAAKGWQAGGELAAWGVSERTISLTEGVVKTMLWNKLKVVLGVAVIATGMLGFALGQWTSADAREPSKPAATLPPPPAPMGEAPVAATQPSPAPTPPQAAPQPAPAATGRRQVATIRIPTGTWVKDVEAAPYGSGRLTWTFQDDQVVGLIEVNVMGFEVEIATHAEFAMSSHGTIYGVVTAAKVNHIRYNAGLAGFGGDQADALKAYTAFLPLVEPLINEFVTDLPFSYQVRVHGDRLTIHNYRILLSGPNPLSKLAILGEGLGEIGAILVYFQAIGTAIEGTYTSADAEEQPKPAAPRRKPIGGVKAGMFPMLRNEHAADPAQRMDALIGGMNGPAVGPAAGGPQGAAVGGLIGAATDPSTTNNPTGNPTNWDGTFPHVRPSPNLPPADGPPSYLPPAASATKKPMTLPNGKYLPHPPQYHPGDPPPPIAAGPPPGSAPLPEPPPPLPPSTPKPVATPKPRPSTPPTAAAIPPAKG